LKDQADTVKPQNFFISVLVYVAMATAAPNRN
jgi:hypothetical protein